MTTVAHKQLLIVIETLGAASAFTHD